MRRINTYIHQLADWPQFTWQATALESLLGTVRNQQGRLLGRLDGLGLDLRAEATLQTLTLDVLKSSEIEGEILPRRRCVRRWRTGWAWNRAASLQQTAA
ncbi:DUF4172 domain-containing protein [Hymenobacter sp. 5414T-23]|uniref:DUF4172 domain-containing protein n=1 Tax=Hymenobacter sp. 5414T-23 TaxID=2932252 RepID=UPI00293F5F36|nr:DUF4172 domain-containing protein [Hymenobacter sp. 5414T-23]